MPHRRARSAPASGWAAPLLVALGTLTGLQILRAMFPLLVYVAKDRFGLGSPALGGIGLVLFGLAWFGPGRATSGRPLDALARTAIPLLLARLVLQIWPGDPAVSLVVSAAGTVAFLFFLAAVARAASRAPLADAVLAGATGDVAIHAVAGTRDLHWGGFGPTVVTLLLLLLGGLAVRQALRVPSSPREPAHNARASGAALFALGPWLALQLELLGNVARASARTGYETPASGALVAGGLGLATLIAAVLSRVPGKWSRGVALLAAAILAPAVWRLEPAGTFSVAFLPLAQIAAGALLVLALRSTPTPSSRRASIGAATGGITFLLLVFLHYASYDLPLPGEPIVWSLLAIAALAIAAAAASPGERSAPSRARLGSVAAVALVATMLPLLRPSAAPDLRERVDSPLRAATFNLHNGFDERGGFALERMLDSLAAEHPDVIALQEVSRGWLANGGADLFELARERLAMAGTFGPATSSDWGNAVFTRVLPVAVERLPLPPRDLPLTRQATVVSIPTTVGPEPLRVIGTHFHHREDDEDIRVQQATALVHALGPSGRSLLLGDFNALPGSRSLSLLGAAGWQDAGAAASPPLPPTYPSRGPVRRIDTILAGDGCSVISSRVAGAWGSDHRAVVAEIRLERP
ncbi:MAG: endonuclease/exonuclease/phosphatase family protein [bacterium]